MSDLVKVYTIQKEFISIGGKQGHQNLCEHVQDRTMVTWRPIFAQACWSPIPCTTLEHCLDVISQVEGIDVIELILSDEGDFYNVYYTATMPTLDHSEYYRGLCFVCQIHRAEVYNG